MLTVFINTEGLRKSLFRVSLVSPVFHCLIANKSFNINFFNGTHGHYFLSLLKIFKFLSLNSTDFRAIIHHKRDTGALYNCSFCHHYTRLAPGF